MVYSYVNKNTTYGLGLVKATIISIKNSSSISSTCANTLTDFKIPTKDNKVKNWKLKSFKSVQCNSEAVKLLKLFHKFFFIYFTVFNSSVQLWNSHTLEIFSQIIICLLLVCNVFVQLWNCETLEINSEIFFCWLIRMQFIFVTVKLWDYWNFLTNNFSSI